MIILEIINLVINNGRQGLLYALAFLITLVLSLVLHEVAHGLVALWNGDDTAKRYGRLTLNPMRHFDWIGLLMMLIVGFGWAKPVPVNPNNYKKYRTGCVTVALAGIITNILLAFIFAIPTAILGELSTEGMSESVWYLTLFFYYLGRLMVKVNVSLALFNLLPLYPLDGYRLVASFVNERNNVMTFLRRYSLYILLGLMLLNSLTVVTEYAPLNLYIGKVGGWIQEGFIAFWRLIF